MGKNPFFHLPFHLRMRNTVFKINCNIKSRKESTPFFAVLNEFSAVKQFLTALEGDFPDKAEDYISKSLHGKINLKDMNRLFHGKNIKYMDNAFCLEKSGAKTISMLVAGNNQKVIIHFKVIEEPDSSGRWKINEIRKQTL